MTPKEGVLTRYPEAVAVHQDPIYVMGQKAPVREGGWVVLSAPYLGAQLLGSGQEEADAWLNAITTMKPMRRIGFKEWLEEQAECEGSAEQRQRIIEEWKAAVAG